MDGSATRIYNAALGTPEDHLVIFLAHNGPTGVSVGPNYFQMSCLRKFVTLLKYILVLPFQALVLI